MKGLPTESFVTHESDGKEHYWEWREAGSNDLDIRVLQFKKRPEQGSQPSASHLDERMLESNYSLQAKGDEASAPARGVTPWKVGRFASPSVNSPTNLRQRRNSLWSYLQGTVATTPTMKDASRLTDSVVDEYMASVPFFRWSREMVERVATRLKKLQLFREVSASPPSPLACSPAKRFRALLPFPFQP